ncbi:MAG TPA: hypothetical protein VGE74_21735 [Gemmata sp.]
MAGSEVSSPVPFGLVAKRIRFAAHSVASGHVRRTFKHPRFCLAVEDEIAWADLPREPPKPEPLDELFVVLVPPGAAGAWAETGAGWLAPVADPDAPAVSVTHKGDRIEWRPGRAVVFLAGAVRDEVLPAVAEFAFYEAELRRLEGELDAREAVAQEDVPRTQTIRRRDKAHWPRFEAAIEAFARMRLAAARLFPRFEHLSGVAPGPSAAKLAARLLRHAQVERRSALVDARLEACEDLYEGANDRVADHKGWRDGHVLEVIIVLLLLLEVVLLTWDLLVRTGD